MCVRTSVCTFNVLREDLTLEFHFTATYAIEIKRKKVYSNFITCHMRTISIFALTEGNKKSLKNAHRQERKREKESMKQL